ncbi:MAG TPA: HEAT repeat domain-containing protein [Acidobacteriota bacterium]|nr:HEAT repeat domain-containing protein [Acidobacteriota bacterium]
MAARFTSVLLHCCLVAGFVWADGDPYEKIRSFDYGQSREAFWTIENQIRQANEAQRLQIEQKLIAALKSPEATIPAKESMCRLLANLGSCGSVSAMVPLLADENLREAARSALQSLPCPGVDEAFRNALTAAKGRDRVNFVNSLGDRRDRDSVPLLAGLLNSPDTLIVEAALTALGRIGSDQAADVIRQAVVPERLQSTKADAYLQCAESLAGEGRTAKAREIFQEVLAHRANGPIARAGALRGIVVLDREAALPQLLDALKSDELEVRRAAARLVNEIPGTQVTQELVKAVATVPTDTRVFLITALARRADPIALPELQKQADSLDPAVRLAALEALGPVGDQTCVDTLFRAAKESGPVGQTAAESLRLLRGPTVNDKIAQYLGDRDASQRALALRTLAARRFPRTADLAFEALRDPDLNVRLESWRTLGLTANASSLPLLVSELLKLEQAREQQAAEQAVQAVAAPLPKDQAVQTLADALEGATPQQKLSLLRAMGRVGGPKAFEIIRTAVSGDDPAIQDTAIRILSDWGDYSTAADLLKLSKSGKNPTHRILGLRGYVRLARSSPELSDEQRIMMFREALRLAERAEEKRLVLGALGNVPSAGALDAVGPYLRDATVHGEAQTAYLRIARSLASSDPEHAREAFKKLIQSTDNPDLRQQAQEALQALEN